MRALLHPIALISLALWLVNDHVLKYTIPGVVTGKLSDIAGMVVAPLALFTAFHALSPRTWRRARWFHLAPWTSVVFVATIFAAVKLFPTANAIWCDAATAARAPIHALAKHLHGAAFDERVILVADPTDLVALPFGLVAAWIAMRQR